MELRVHVELVLHKTGKMGTQYACLVSGCIWFVVSNDGIFSEGDTNSNDLVPNGSGIECVSRAWDIPSVQLLPSVSSQGCCNQDGTIPEIPKDL